VQIFHGLPSVDEPRNRFPQGGQCIGNTDLNSEGRQGDAYTLGLFVAATASA
jgi:hypothetical protein